MVFDPRTAEKSIAPIINEEVDGRNLISYRFGDELSIPLIFQTFQVDSEKNVLYEKDLFMPLDNVIDHITRFSIVVTSDQSREIDWIVNVNGEQINLEKLSVSLQQTGARFSIKLDPGLNRIQCVFGNTEGLILGVQIRISIDLSYKRQRISTRDLGVDHFYVEKIILNKGDVVRFDSFGNVFSDESIEFNKPIAVREINFISGRPKVIFYYFTRLD